MQAINGKVTVIFKTAEQGTIAKGRVHDVPKVGEHVVFTELPDFVERFVVDSREWRVLWDTKLNLHPDGNMIGYACWVWLVPEGDYQDE